MRTPDRLQPGRRFLNFTIVRLLGRGGMGAVHEVVGRGGRRYALKVLQPSWQRRDEQIQRMLDEGTVMVGIKHANIVEVHDHGVHDDLVWMLMELLTGETLRARLLRDGPLPLELACAVLRSAAYAAEQCHLLGIIHRDIKPENFMLTADHRVKMLDFGIAHIHRSTVTQDPIGTPAYMAPEQFNTRLGVSPATDVYALGVMGYEMLVGWNPFLRDDSGKERNAWELCFEQAFTMPQPLEELGVPTPIAAVVTRAIAKDPRARYERGGALAEAIWSAWKQVRGGEDIEESAGLLSAPEELRFGTGPMPPEARAPRRTEAARAPTVRATSERLPKEMADAAAVEAYLTGRRRAPEAASGGGGEEASRAADVPRVVIEIAPRGGAPAPPHPRGGTVRLPNADRDPSCVAMEREAPPPRYARGGTVRLPDADRDPSCVAAEARAPTPTTVTAPVAWGTQPTPGPGLSPRAYLPWDAARAEPRRQAPVMGEQGGRAPSSASRLRRWAWAGVPAAAVAGAALLLFAVLRRHDNAAPEGPSAAAPTVEPTASAAGPAPAEPTPSAPEPPPVEPAASAAIEPAEMVAAPASASAPAPRAPTAPKFSSSRGGPARSAGTGPRRSSPPEKPLFERELNLDTSPSPSPPPPRRPRPF